MRSKTCILLTIFPIVHCSCFVKLFEVFFFAIIDLSSLIAWACFLFTTKYAQRYFTSDIRWTGENDERFNSSFLLRSSKES